MREVTTAQIEAEQATLRRVATLVAQGASADELFRAVTAEVGQLFGADLAGLSQYVSDDAVLAVATWSAAGEHPDVSGTWPLDGDSISGTVFRTARPVRQDHWEDARGSIAEVCRKIGIRSSVASPIVVDDRVWGALMIHSLTARLPPGIESRMAEFTELVGIAVANIDARTAVRRLVAEQAALRRVATLVAREAAADDVFGAVAEEVGRLFGVSASTVYRYVGDESALVVASWGEPDALMPVGMNVPLDGDNIAVRIRRGASSVRIQDVAEVTGAIGERARRLGTRSGVGAPIIVTGELWGGIAATSRLPEPLPVHAESRIAQFTELVATAIANIEARAELAASRARLVAAADEERRRIVRDLHDGAQQRLVHTVLTLNLARQAVVHAERARDLLGQASALAQQATTELRELAHGILPSVLAHGGLPAGADALASRMPVPVTIEVPAERFPAAIEAAAYFVMAEALTRVADDGGAQSAAVTARVEQDTLDVVVCDDSGGPRLLGPWALGLEDRLAAAGGRLEAGGAGGVHAAIPLDVS